MGDTKYDTTFPLRMGDKKKKKKKRMGGTKYDVLISND